MAFKHDMTVALCMAYMLHARVDDLDLDARAQLWVGKGKTKIGVVSSQQLSNQFFYFFIVLRTLDFENFYMA